jgi:hypothetical protein
LSAGRVDCPERAEEHKSRASAATEMAHRNIAGSHTDHDPLLARLAPGRRIAEPVNCRANPSIAMQCLSVDNVID